MLNEIAHCRAGLPDGRVLALIETPPQCTLKRHDAADGHSISVMQSEAAYAVVIRRPDGEHFCTAFPLSLAAASEAFHLAIAELYGLGAGARP